MRILFFIIILVFSGRVSHANEEALTAVADYFAGLKNLQATFVQIGPDGARAEGDFYYRHTGEMRFSYQNPGKQVIIAGPTWLSIQDQAGKQANRYPLSASPLGRFIRSGERLDKTRYLAGLTISEDRVVVRLMDHKSPGNGQLHLIFNYPDIALTGWRVTDMQQQQTYIYLSNLTQPEMLARSLFFVDESEGEFD